MPEFNLIQAPELLRKLSQLVGLRQAHVVPTLNEGVQAVVILADVRDQERRDQQEITTVPCSTGGVFTDNLVDRYFELSNDTSFTWRLRRFKLHTVSGSAFPPYRLVWGWRDVPINPAVILSPARLSSIGLTPDSMTVASISIRSTTAGPNVQIVSRVAGALACDTTDGNVEIDFPTPISIEPGPPSFILQSVSPAGAANWNFTAFLDLEVDLK